MDKNIIYRFFEGQVSDEEILAIKEWAESSEENKILLQRERKLYNAMILVGQTKPSAKQEQKVGRRNHILYEFLKIACTVVLTAGITFGLFSIGNNNNNKVAMQTITVPAGQRVNVDLPDGTNVWLNAGTKMQYPLSFMKNKREVIIDGEAYFDVAKNEKSPFIVRTPFLNIKVLGTKFDVNATSKRNIFEVTLMEGKVNIYAPQDENNAIILLPYQKAIYKGEKLLISKLEDFEEYRWKEGLYSFRDKTFNEIIQDLERYYDIQIEVSKDVVISETLTGKFRIVDGLDYALRVLQNNVKFDYNRDKENDIIYTLIPQHYYKYNFLST